MLSTNTWYRPFPLDPWAQIDKGLGGLITTPFEQIRNNALKQPLAINTNVVDGIFELAVDMPGVKVDDVDVQMAGKILTVKASRGKRSYEFTYKVPSDYAVDSASATLEDGILIVRFTKLPELEPRKIKVKLL